MSELEFWYDFHSPWAYLAATQIEAIGDQHGGRVGFFLHTDDFARDHARLAAHGARFDGEPRHEAYGTVTVFEDLYGNRWDLIGARDA